MPVPGQQVAYVTNPRVAQLADGSQRIEIDESRVKVDEVLSRYPNADELLLKSSGLAIQCRAIMSNSCVEH